MPRLCFAWLWVLFLLACGTLTVWAGNPPEPGLTARLSEIALLKIPAPTKLGIVPVESQLRERLQILPVVSNDDPAGQLKLVFTAAKDNGASADLMASAARTVVALALPTTDSREWEDFKCAIALRSQLGDVSVVTVTKATDVAALVTGLKGQSKALMADLAAASKSGDGTRMADLRKRAATLAAQNIANVWAGLLSIQPPPKIVAPVTNNSTESPATAAETSAPEAIEPVVPVAVESSPNPVLTDPVSYVGNKTSKKFHRSTCRQVPGPTNQISIPNRPEAIRMGFSPCKICKP